jgi:integrase/recombinase XerD
LELSIAGKSPDYIQSVRHRLEEFAKFCSYQCNLNDINIYINECRKIYSPESVRKRVVDIKRLMKKINAPFADKIKIPKVPKRRKIVIKVRDIQNLLKQVEMFDCASMRFRTKAVIILTATSGLRSEEVYKLTLDDIDVDNRIVNVRAEVAKDYEERVTFFSKEAQEALIKYLENCENCKLRTNRLFAESNIRRAFERLDTWLRLKHMRKFFSQQSDRLGMPTAIKKILMGYVVGDEEFVIPRVSDVDLSHYDFQDED